MFSISKKGLSPLIATVLLIAIVMTTYGVLSGWAKDFARSMSTTIGERSKTKIRCSDSSLYIENGSYNATNDKLSVRMYNNGYETLKNFELRLVLSNETVKEYSILPANVTLTPGEVEIFYNSSISTCNINEIIVFSSTCPIYSKDSIKSGDINFYNC